MRKISPRWQFVIILAFLLFLWGGSELWHSCIREQIEAQEDDPLILFPLETEFQPTDTLVMPPSDSLTVAKKKTKSKSSFQSRERALHTRQHLDEPILDVPIKDHR